MCVHLQLHGPQFYTQVHMATEAVLTNITHSTRYPQNTKLLETV